MRNGDIHIDDLESISEMPPMLAELLYGGSTSRPRQRRQSKTVKSLLTTVWGDRMNVSLDEVFRSYRCRTQHLDTGGSPEPERHDEEPPMPSLVATPSHCSVTGR
jgi:hypothetical protein